MAGGGDTPELVAAVCNAGALGSIGAAYLTPEQIIATANNVRSKTDRPFGINLFAPQPASTAPANAALAVKAVAPFYAELNLSAPEPPQLPPDRFDEQVQSVLDSGASVFSFTFGTDSRRRSRRRKVARHPCRGYGHHRRRSTSTPEVRLRRRRSRREVKPVVIAAPSPQIAPPP